MPLEKGGRADKQGNSYEINCVIYELLKVLDEVNYSVVIEALGEDEAVSGHHRLSDAGERGLEGKGQQRKEHTEADGGSHAEKGK